MTNKLRLKKRYFSLIIGLGLYSYGCSIYSHFNEVKYKLDNNNYVHEERLKRAKSSARISEAESYECIAKELREREDYECNDDVSFRQRVNRSLAAEKEIKFGEQNLFANDGSGYKTWGVIFMIISILAIWANWNEASQRA